MNSFFCFSTSSFTLSSQSGWFARIARFRKARPSAPSHRSCSCALSCGIYHARRKMFRMPQESPIQAPGWSDNQIAAIKIACFALCIAVLGLIRQRWVAFTRCKYLSRKCSRLVVELESLLNANGLNEDVLRPMKADLDRGSSIPQRLRKNCKWTGQGL